MRIGYLVPEFPSQTHAFFWREVQALQEITPNTKTKAELTRASGLTGAQVTHLFDGTLNPSTKNLRRLARAFNHDYFDFVALVGKRIKGAPPTPPPAGRKRLKLDLDLTDDEFQRLTELLANRRKK